MNVRRSSKPVFGRNLEELFLEHKGLPSVFWDTLKYLSRHAMTTEGLFRTKADGRKVLNMKRMFDAGQDPFRVLTAEDQHVVAGVLKLWLGCLPQPVIPADMYSILLKTQSIPDRMRRMLQMHAVLKQMPASTLQVLYPLMEFLHHHSINQRRKPDSPIAPPDLARIFAPLLLRPSGCNSISCESDLAAAVNVADMMIKDYRTIFTVKGAAAIQLRLDAQQQENRPANKPGGLSNMLAAAASCPATGLPVQQTVQQGLVRSNSAPPSLMKPGAALLSQDTSTNAGKATSSGKARSAHVEQQQQQGGGSPCSLTGRPKLTVDVSGGESAAADILATAAAAAAESVLSRPSKRQPLSELRISCSAADEADGRSTASPGAISFGSPDAQATAVQSPPAGVSGLQCFPPLEPIGSGYLGQSSGACAYAVAHPGVAQDSLIDTIVDQLLFDATCVLVDTSAPATAIAGLPAAAGLQVQFDDQQEPRTPVPSSPTCSNSSADSGSGSPFAEDSGAASPCSVLPSVRSACGKSRFEDKAGDSTQLGEAFGWREAAAGLLQPVAQLARLL